MRCRPDYLWQQAATIKKGGILNATSLPTLPIFESETLMKIKNLMSVVALGLALSTAGGLANAQPALMEDNSFAGMMVMPKMDTNKDGMVAKAEYLAMMGKIWDMKAKEMKVKGDMMTPTDFAALVNFLSRGEKNR